MRGKCCNMGEERENVVMWERSMGGGGLVTWEKNERGRV